MRTKNPGIHRHNVRFDEETINLLKEQGYTEDSVPEKDKIVYLKTTSNVSSGGDSVDATEELPLEVKNEIVKALNSVPDLEQAGIDVIYDKHSGDFAIIEMNTQPSLRGHLFPMKGQARDVPKAIIDYYFPETKNINTRCKPYYYFDIESVFSSFRDNIVKEITIPKVPNDDLLVIDYKIVFSNLRRRNANWFQREGRLLGIYGNIKVKKNELEIRSLGNKQSLDDYSKVINNKAVERYNIISITETEVDIKKCSSFKLSFEINDLRKKSRKKSQTTQVSKKKEQPLKLEQNYKRKYNKVINSTSWKITKPLRMLGKIKKRIRNKFK